MQSILNSSNRDSYISTEIHMGELLKGSTDVRWQGDYHRATQPSGHTVCTRLVLRRVHLFPKDLGLFIVCLM